MNASMIRRLIAKDLFLMRWPLAGSVAAGLVSIAVMPLSRVSAFVGFVSLICVLVILNITLVMGGVVQERKDKVLDPPDDALSGRGGSARGSCRGGGRRTADRGGHGRRDPFGRVAQADQLQHHADSGGSALLAPGRRGGQPQPRLQLTVLDAETVLRRLLASDTSVRDVEVRQAGLAEAFVELTREAA
jgi:hypothetical protein